MSKSDSESALELATVSLFLEMGFDHADLMQEVFGTENSHGRDTSSEVVFKPRLHAALQKLNPNLPKVALDEAMELLTHDRSAMNPVYANQEIHKLLKQGVPVSWRDADGIEQCDRVQVIHWQSPEDNDFFLAQQMWISGELYKKRCDLVVCVNGLPLIFLELKKPSVAVKHAYDDNLTDYKNNTIPQLWWYNAFILLSNGSESKLGSMTAQWEHFVEWKKIDSEGEEGVISLETMIRGTCEPGRMLDLIENFVVFMEVPGGVAKVVSKNHQFLGVRNAVQSVREIEQNGGRLGVFWHTQGSGKSLSMVFFCQYVRRRIPGNWTFLVVADRKELDGQIYKTFTGTGLVTENECQASKGDHLRQLLTEDHEFVFTLIQKFQTNDKSEYPKLSDRSDIIVITDEAHRSQYDTLAMNMRKALPNAAFIGFTGTPLIAGEEALIYPEEERKTFMSKVSLVVRIHKAIMPDPVAHEFDPLRSVLTVIRDKLRPNPKDVDISHILKDIEELLDVSIAAEGYVTPTKDPEGMAEGNAPHRRLLDLGKIDFEALRKCFDTGRKKTVIEKLRQAIEQRLDAMVKLNKSRLDYLEKFQKMIAEYNSGSRNIEEFFKQLQEFIKELGEEDARAIRQNLSEEELAVYDLLTKPEMDLTEKEREAVKAVSKELLERLKEEKLVLDWRKRQQSRAAVRLCVEEVLDRLPRAYQKDVFQQKCNLVFEHVFDSYQGAGQSIYAVAG